MNVKRSIVFGGGAVLFAALVLYVPSLFARSSLVALPAKTVLRATKGSAKMFGEFAYTNPHGLFVTTSQGNVLRVTSNPSATDPAWSFNGRYLAFETTEKYGVNPILHVYDTIGMHQIFTESNVNRFLWQPGHNLLAILTSKLQFTRFQDAHSVTVGRINGQIEDNYIWSSDGAKLAYAVTDGPVAKRHDVVEEVHVTEEGISPATAEWVSPTEEGIWLAGFLPKSSNILFWPDGQYSASLMADGAPLELWHHQSGQITTYAPMLPYNDYLSLARPDMFAYMAGGPRTISGSHKAIVLVHHGVATTLPTPPGKEVIEPNLNPATLNVVAVLAKNDTNASWSLLQNYDRWVKTRQLVVFSHLRWVIWKNAGYGVTDPVWAPNNRGVFYLAHNELYYLGGKNLYPQSVVGPIPSTGGYYGEILASSLWELLPLAKEK